MTPVCKLIAAGWKPVEGVADPIDKSDAPTVDSDSTAKLGLSKGTFANPGGRSPKRETSASSRPSSFGG